MGLPVGRGVPSRNDRFADEVEQVRWGSAQPGQLRSVRSLVRPGCWRSSNALYHQEHLYGMVISSRMSSVLAYNATPKAQAEWLNDFARWKALDTPGGLAETDVRLTFPLPVRRGYGWLPSR